MTITILAEVVHVVGTFIAVLLTRWLLALSTPQKDICWLKQQHWYQRLFRLRFYRGMELAHQWKAERLLRHL
jgi:hypothetical protein